MAKRRKVYPQLVAIELILLAAFGTGAYLLAEHFSTRSALPVFLAGAALDRALILVLRHRNKPVRLQMPVTRKAAGRAPQRRRSGMNRTDTRGNLTNG